MQRTGSRFGSFDFDVITGPVEPHPAAKPAEQGSLGQPAAAPAQRSPVDATKPAK